MGKIIVARVYDELDEIEAMRILVDRLWPRGIRKEELKLDYWAREVAPSTALRKEFNHQDDRFPEFREEYLVELDASDEAGAFVAKLRDWLEDENIVLLYAARSREVNHATVLKDWLEEELEKDRDNRQNMTRMNKGKHQ